jgi:thiamine pyrophosphokinase
VAVADGDFDSAMKEVVAALAGAPQNQKAPLEGLKKRIDGKEDING